MASTVPWSQTCDAAVRATEALRSAFWDAAQADGAGPVADYLLAWHCKIDDFEPDSVPSCLTTRVPVCKGFVSARFPACHTPTKTEWLPRKPDQPKVRRQLQHVSDLFDPAAWTLISTFFHEHSQWLRGLGPRPEACAVSELHWADWARGIVLELRNLPDVRELDYSALTPTKFNTAAIQEALAEYEDQEVVSFMVLGACRTFPTDKMSVALA
jgi:hypothetical protein